MSKQLLLFCLFVTIASCHVSAQARNLDSLERVNQAYLEEDTTKIKLLYIIGGDYARKDPVKGIGYVDQAIALAENLNTPFFKAKGYMTKAYILLLTGDYYGLIDASNKALAILEPLNRKKDIGNLYSYLGSAYYYQANYSKASEYFEKGKAVFESIGDNKGRMRILSNLGPVYVAAGELKKALGIFETAREYFENIDDPVSLAVQYENLGNVYSDMSEDEKSLQNFQKALEIDTKIDNKIGISKHYGSLASSYYRLGNFPLSLQYFQKALRLNDQLDDKQTLANNLSNIGDVYASLFDYPKAEEYFEKSIRLANTTGDQSLIARNYMSLGSTWYQKGDFRKAGEYFTKANLIYEAIDYKPGIFEVYYQLGQLENKNKNYTAALDLYKKSMAMSDETGFGQNSIKCLTNIAEVYNDAPNETLAQVGIQPEQRFPESLRLQLQALEAAEKENLLPEILNSWELLSRTYEKTGDYIKAYDAYKKYIMVRDSVIGQETKKKIIRTEIQYEFDKKEAVLQFEQQLTQGELEKQKLFSSQQQQALRLKEQALTISNKEKDLQHLAFLKEKAENQEKEQQLALAEVDKKLQAADLAGLVKEKALQLETLARKNALIGFLIVGLIALFLTAFVLYLLYRQKQARKEVALQSQFTQQLFDNTEAERGRIARDLHDGVSHELLSLKQNLSKQPDAAAKIDGIINDIRQISRNLHPVMLESIGLKLSLETLCDQFMEQDKLFISHDIQYTRRLPGTAELQIFRIVQEALSNATKYAEADACKVALTEQNNRLQLLIQDNGRGFDVDRALNSGKAFGLRSILQRSKAIGGRAEIRSGSSGTMVEVELG